MTHQDDYHGDSPTPCLQAIAALGRRLAHAEQHLQAVEKHAKEHRNCLNRHHDAELQRTADLGLWS